MHNDKVAARGIVRIKNFTYQKMGPNRGKSNSVAGIAFAAADVSLATTDAL